MKLYVAREFDSHISKQCISLKSFLYLMMILLVTIMIAVGLCGFLDFLVIYTKTSHCLSQLATQLPQLILTDLCCDTCFSLAALQGRGVHSCHKLSSDQGLPVPIILQRSLFKYKQIVKPGNIHGQKHQVKLKSDFIS